MADELNETALMTVFVWACVRIEKLKHSSCGV